MPNNNRTVHIIIFLAGALLAAPSILAHHGAVTNGAIYLTDDFIELEGEITEVFWRNPHARARMSVLDDNGEETIWELELGPGPRGFEGRGINADDFLGHARAAGYQSKRDSDSLGVLHVLLPDGREYAQGNRELLWGDERVVNNSQELDPEKVAEARRTADRIFRTWGRRMRNRPPAEGYAHLLNERGRELAAQYDAARDNPELECRTGVVNSMMDPVPMEISDGGDSISIHVAEYNVRRTIYLGDAASGVEPVPSPLGFSVGHWEGDVLVVQTTRIDFPYLDPYGTPQSDQVEYLERLSASDDGATLNYSITVTDPVFYLAPITLERPRQWTPGVEIPEFNCAADWAGGAE